jgi:hypothetical protein
MRARLQLLKFYNLTKMINLSLQILNRIKVNLSILAVKTQKPLKPVKMSVVRLLKKKRADMIIMKPKSSNLLCSLESSS